jgi:hypothetical protein
LETTLGFSFRAARHDECENMNRIIAKALVAAVMSVGTVSDAADKAAVYVSGNSLNAWCMSASQSQRGLCDGYILGIADALEVSKIGGFAACIPAQVRTRSWAQILNVVKQFLASHPEKRPLFSATTLVASALAEMFTCH